MYVNFSNSKCVLRFSIFVYTVDQIFLKALHHIFKTYKKRKNTHFLITIPARRDFPQLDIKIRAQQFYKDETRTISINTFRKFSN